MWAPFDGNFIIEILMKNENVEGKKQTRRSKFNDGLEKRSYVVSAYRVTYSWTFFICLFLKINCIIEKRQPLPLGVWNINNTTLAV